MKQAVRLTERIRGDYDQVLPVLRLDFDRIVSEPLEELRVQVGDGSIGRRVEAHVGPLQVGGRTLGVAPRSLEIALRWQAADHPMLFPTMSGVLRLRDAGRDTIELRLAGHYTPPLGAIGALADRFAGHQAATASLHAYVREVARRLDAALAEHARLVPRPSLRPIERSP